jgi:hypothetical protein
MNIRIPGLSKWRVLYVNDRGFFDGAQGIEAARFLEELTAEFERKKTELRNHLTKRIKQLEARLETLTRIAPEAQARWERIKNQYDRIPPLIVPVVKIITSAGGIAAEAIILAGILDILAISNPTHQLVAAAAIVTMAAIIYHFALESTENPGAKHARLSQILAGITTIALIVLGVLRARQIAFSAALCENPLARFLNTHPVLGTILFVFLTLLFPIAAALALHSGYRGIREWREYTRARKLAARHSAQREQTEKKLEAQREVLNHGLASLEQQRNEWSSSYLHHHEQGMKMGAKQQPYWEVVVKSLAWTAAAFLCALFVVDYFPIFTPAQAVALLTLPPTVVGLIAWTHYHHVRNHPTPKQFAKQQKVTFVRDQKVSTTFPGHTLPASPNNQLRFEIPPSYHEKSGRDLQ